MVGMSLCEGLHSEPNGRGTARGVNPSTCRTAWLPGDDIRQVTRDNFSRTESHPSWDAARSTLSGKGVVVQRGASPHPATTLYT